jgi:hypothetical protein
VVCSRRAEEPKQKTTTISLMKKAILLLTVFLSFTASLAMAQIAASLAFDDSSTIGTIIDSNPAPNIGLFNSGTGTFTLDVNLTFAGGTSTGLSYWLQTESGTASNISITDETYVTFSNPQSGLLPKTFTDTNGANIGFLSDKSATQTGDLGATGSEQNPGTYQVSTVQFTLDNMPAGTYHLFTTDLTGAAQIKPSEATINFEDAFISPVGYTFTVVPEPATWSLVGLGGLGSFGLTWLRARKRS